MEASRSVSNHAQEDRSWPIDRAWAQGLKSAEAVRALLLDATGENCSNIQGLLQWKLAMSRI
ncbi:MAG: hypothetical protein ABS54_15865 [Hyphomicrobium sp. SCN 65-11]|nr:MAG: hypothetical protein ABS54_15865 [Hyphomicrobium sp. SCN 65-11]